jgi:hypothetical protein
MAFGRGQPAAGSDNRMMVVAVAKSIDGSRHSVRQEGYSRRTPWLGSAATVVRRDEGDCERFLINVIVDDEASGSQGIVKTNAGDRTVSAIVSAPVDWDASPSRVSSPAHRSFLPQRLREDGK